MKLGGAAMDEPPAWDVVVDRASHLAPYYRTHLKQLAVQGATVVNNPFLRSATDRVVVAALAQRLGIPTPRTVALPNKAYGERVDHGRSLCGLRHPLDWDALLERVGLPCVLKPATANGSGAVAVCRSRDELLLHYDRSGTATVVAQELIEWRRVVRCVCVGRRDACAMDYDPSERRRDADAAAMPARLRHRVVRDSLALARTIGVDLVAVDWAIADDVPWLIDFAAGAPDLDASTLGPDGFEWAVGHVADLALRLALRTERHAGPPDHDSLFAPTPIDADPEV